MSPLEQGREEERSRETLFKLLLHSLGMVHSEPDRDLATQVSLAMARLLPTEQPSMN